MDDLEFRRRIIATPNDRNPEFLAAVNSVERKKKLAEQQSFESKIAQALAVEPPEGLAEQLILRQRFSQHKEKQQKFKWAFAMAASLVLTVTATLALWHRPHANLADYALAHVHHEPQTLISIDESATLAQLNVKLASYGISAQQSPGHIYYVNHCDFKGKRSLHLVLEHQGQKLTVFVVPEFTEFEKAPETFSDQQYQGVLSAHKDTGLIVIGDDLKAAQELQNKLDKSFQWGRI